jgi:hypothetical protein
MTKVLFFCVKISQKRVKEELLESVYWKNS